MSISPKNIKCIALNLDRCTEIWVIFGQTLLDPHHYQISDIWLSFIYGKSTDRINLTFGSNTHDSSPRHCSVLSFIMVRAVSMHFRTDRWSNWPHICIWVFLMNPPGLIDFQSVTAVSQLRFLCLWLTKKFLHMVTSITTEYGVMNQRSGNNTYLSFD